MGGGGGGVGGGGGGGGGGRAARLSRAWNHSPPLHHASSHAHFNRRFKYRASPAKRLAGSERQKPTCEIQIPSTAFSISPSIGRLHGQEIAALPLPPHRPWSVIVNAKRHLEMINKLSGPRQITALEQEHDLRQHRYQNPEDPAWINYVFKPLAGQATSKPTRPKQTKPRRKRLTFERTVDDMHRKKCSMKIDRTSRLRPPCTGGGGGFS